MSPFISVPELRTCDIPLVIVNARIFEFPIYSGKDGDHIKDANATSFLMHSIVLLIEWFLVGQFI